MKKLVVGSCILLSACIHQSCGSNTGGTDSSKDSVGSRDTMAHKMDSSAMNKMAKPVDKDASDFAMKAAGLGRMEVDLGNLAKEKAQSQRVKDFGSMMVEDHTKANNELSSLAGSLNISMATDMGSDEKKEMDKLNKKSGKDFDKAYMTLMLDGRTKVLAEFRKMADKGSDSDIKSFAARTLPVLEKHLDSAKGIMGKH